MTEIDWSIPGLEASGFPLCVDLDGTLITENITRMALRRAATQNIRGFIGAFCHFLKGGRRKSITWMAHQGLYHGIKPTFRQEVIQALKVSGKITQLILVTGAPQGIADTLSCQLGLFTQVWASTSQVYLVGKEKQRCLVDLLGKERFWYLGNSHQDIPVWRHSYGALMVESTPLNVQKQVMHYPRWGILRESGWHMHTSKRM